MYDDDDDAVSYNDDCNDDIDAEGGERSGLSQRLVQLTHTEGSERRVRVSLMRSRTQRFASPERGETDEEKYGRVSKGQGET